MAEPGAAGADPGRPATNEEWFARALRSIPGGVDSPVRSFASVGGTPFTVDRGEGAVRRRRRGHAATSTSSSPTARSCSATRTR